jgi:nucleoside-diphosphate-sugar epimerase
MRCGLQGQPITIKGNPLNLRSYLYPADAIKQILGQSLIEEPSYSQVGSCKSMTILNVAQVVANEFGVDVEIPESPITQNDNYVPKDVPVEAEKDFTLSISQWAEWLKSGARNVLSD